MHRVVAASLLLSSVCMAHAETPKFIDTQAQFDPAYFNYSAAVDVMLSEMDRVGISKTLIVPPPFARAGRGVYDGEEIVKFVKAHPARFDFLAGGGSLNLMIQRYAPDEVSDSVKSSFRKRCEEILAMGAIGFGEVTAEHLSLPGMGEHHPYESTAPDHPLLLLLADIAAEKDVPIDIHFDVFPAPTPAPPPLRRNNPEEFKENLAAFERLLDHNPKARFNWAHVGSDPGGQRTPPLMHNLLTRHPNLHSAFRIVQGGPRPVQPLDENNQLKPAWAKLIQDFPDRFTLHTDIFYTGSWPPDRGPKQSHEMAKKLLDQLPPDVAAKLAHENSRRIYKLAN